MWRERSHRDEEESRSFSVWPQITYLYGTSKPPAPTRKYFVEVFQDNECITEIEWCVYGLANNLQHVLIVFIKYESEFI